MSNSTRLVVDVLQAGVDRDLRVTTARVRFSVRTVHGAGKLVAPAPHSGRIRGRPASGTVLPGLDSRFAASPVEAGGLLYFPAESGVTYVLKAASRFEIVAENDLGAPILASPAVVDGKL